MKKPGFWRLFWAYIVDFVITFFTAWLVWKLFWICFPHAFMGIKGDWDTFFLLLILLVACTSIPNLLYFVGSESLWGKTLAKRLFGVEVLEGNKQPSAKKLWKAYGIDFLLIIPVPTACLMIGLFIQALVCFDCYPGVFYWCVFWSMISLYFSAIILYFAVSEHFFGKTLGKKLMGLQVVQKEETK
ncbi:MAG: RDD family protein [Elusimicrobiaceae bacterium]|nr:RDD family protein [Elusimicrobiaceae bacterium]